MTFSVNITDQSQPFYIDSVSGCTRAPFVHASLEVAVFTSERKAMANSRNDMTFEHSFTTSQVGMNYVTFPSMPLNQYVKDTFTAVAVYDDTRVTVPNVDTSLGTYEVTLDKAGDTFDLELYANGFRHVTGSKPFYLYARLGGTGGNNLCTVTLLADHLWTGQYSVHLTEPWTLLPNIYVVVVGKNPDMETVTLVNLDSSQTITHENCQKVTGTSYEACYFRLSSTTVGPYSLTRPSGEKFAAYMFGSKGQAAACHHLGMNFTATSGGHPNLRFDEIAFLDSVQAEESDLCHEVTTAPSRKRRSVWSSPPITTSTTEEVTETPLPLCETKGQNLTESSEEFQEMLESISEFIRVDSVNTSQSRRKKESAQDHRPSSVSLGVLSCCLVFATLGILVISDIGSLVLMIIELVKR
ncbi:hypothetical protein ElyMa_004948400 [Elysia marginata]|uniref:IgGFc-binding protein N-terminal domain-containing protein n=1 Tax=Elysia marginata TaxID=1093978 RepID=A0AAV4J3P1_9GAST|nr:hypothetical protein ElyMa_004948400 [Elysia marginata]